MKGYEKFEHDEDELKKMKHLRLKIMLKIQNVLDFDYDEITVIDMANSVHLMADALTWLTP